METEALKALWQLAFGDEPWFIDGFFETAYSPERCRTAVIDGRLAGMLHWFDLEYRGQKLAYLYAVATHPDFRGRRICTRLMEQTQELLRDRGYAAALLLPAGEGLREMYAKMGYRDESTVTELACEADGKTDLREISGRDYAALRREYLPKDGAVQEGESIRFLEKCARLYAGEDFLLAASREGERLNGIELLGDAQKAPGILGVLGCESGSFRTPGGETPTAMALRLRENVEIPGYLGLTFE